MTRRTAVLMSMGSPGAGAATSTTGVSSLLIQHMEFMFSNIMNAGCCCGARECKKGAVPC
jgi:hypothetical protein